jgi:hypothetical protein
MRQHFPPLNQTVTMCQSDSTWLDLGGRLRDVVLQEHHRAYAALQDLPFPERQDLQLITLVGDKMKSAFIHHLFSLHSSTNHKKILLRRIPGYSESNCPLLLADCELHNVLTLANRTSGGIEEHSLNWHRNIPRALEPSTLAHLVYTQLLLPFSTIMCFFARDFGGTEEVAKFLASWLMTLRNRSSEFPSSTFARVLILVEWRDLTGFDEKLATTEFITQLRHVISTRNGNFGLLGNESLTNVEFGKILKEQFFEVTILALPGGSGKYINGTQLQTLRTRILRESQDTQNFRRTAKMAFTARHFKAFFHYACCHFANDIVSAFSFVQASRIPNPVPVDFSSHLSEFIKIIPGEHRIILASVIASALCLDNFPPGAHGRWK